MNTTTTNNDQEVVSQPKGGMTRKESIQQLRKDLNGNDKRRLGMITKIVSEKLDADTLLLLYYSMQRAPDDRLTAFATRMANGVKPDEMKEFADLVISSSGKIPPEECLKAWAAFEGLIESGVLGCSKDEGKGKGKTGRKKKRGEELEVEDEQPAKRQKLMAKKGPKVKGRRRLRKWRVGTGQNGQKRRERGLFAVK
ncbi:MAG: hypothetical protein ACTSUE_11275 [Promethearchaeota archaeon]